jgi:hypothetical protein
MKCGICSSGTTELIDKKTGHIYHSCLECEFIFLAEAHILSPAEERERYALHENTLQNAGYVAMFEQFIETAVRPFIHRNGSILEYGSGPGPVLATLLKQKGYCVDIYDPYFAPEKVHLNKTYNLITLTEVIEHVRDPLTLISDLKSHLSGTAYIAIMTEFNHRPEMFLSWYYRLDPTHISFFTARTFERLAELTDLSIAYTNNKKYIVLESSAKSGIC